MLERSDNEGFVDVGLVMDCCEEDDDNGAQGSTIAPVFGEGLDDKEPALYT
jgi:hypothetical protein